jgi:excisionase family DNA binding protein
MDIIIDNISKDESREAKKSFMILRQSFANQPIGAKENVTISIEGKEELVSIPKKVFQVLEQALKNMSEGTSFRLIQEDEMVGTQDAADLLKISRPFLVKLLENGEIPFSKVGTHRRVLRKDVMAFDKKRKIERKKNLDFLTKQAQEFKLGYE